MNPILINLLAQGETAQIRLESSRLAEETARAAIEAAKAALDVAKGETAQAISARDEVLSEAEAAGAQRKQFRTLIEERVTALVNSGLFNLAEASVAAPAATKVKAVRRREAPVASAPQEISAASDVEPSPGTVLVSEETLPPQEDSIDSTQRSGSLPDALREDALDGPVEESDHGVGNTEAAPVQEADEAPEAAEPAPAPTPPPAPIPAAPARPSFLNRRTAS